jgi:hypothetical protein
VLHLGSQLLVVGHVASTYRVVRAGQRRLERLSIPLAGDHQTRQPYPDIVAAGFIVDRRERLRAGVIERVRAFKPTDRRPAEPQRSSQSRQPSDCVTVKGRSTITPPSTTIITDASSPFVSTA